jgi:hypothetical protein
LPEDIPHDARRFLSQAIESVRQLEVLLQLREDPGRAWTADEVSRTQRSSPAWAAQQLEDLRAKRLVDTAEGATGEPAYRYHPADGKLAGTVDTVADLFARRKTTVVALIFGDPSGDPVRSLADAFRIRRPR